MRMTNLKNLFAAWFLLSVIVCVASGNIIYVDDDAPGPTHDGSSWTHAYTGLQNAISAASYCEVWVAEGIYRPTGPGGSRSASFNLKNTVTIKGGYAGFGEPDPNARDINVYETVLSGDLNGDDGPNFANNSENSYHVIVSNYRSPSAILDGFTISGGNANVSGSNDDGGGMYNSAGNPTVLNCTFSGNRAYDDGGGMYNRSGSSPILVNCIFSGNSARLDGGGMRNYKSSPTLTNCTFSHNNSTDGEGGGMSNSDSSPTLTNCTFSGNSAYHFGGGMDNHNSSPTLANCTFIENSAIYICGGMSSYDGSATLTNCIFSGNSAEYYGGGMYNIHTCPTLTNCIFSRNSSDEGGGMYNWNSSPTLTGCTFSGNSADGGGAIWNQRDSNPTLTSCILWGNTATQGDNIYLALYHSFTAGITVSYSNVQGGEAGVHVETGCTLNWGEGNIGANPLFADSVAGDYHLSGGSPCIDAGDPAYIPSLGETDIDGEPRVMGGRVDMGIDEFTSTPTPFIGISPTELMFYATQGGSNPKSQILSIRNIGSGTLNWEIAEDCPWLQVYPPNGESIGQVNEVTLSVDISGLDSGVHNCQLTITANEVANSPQMAAITLYLGVVLRVPSEYTTIQAAIDAAKDGDTVLVADGTYTGTGNRDIDFLGKAITVRSENGPDSCIIDCNGREEELHRGFYFYSGERADSVLEGFTITNGCAYHGGAIRCRYSSSPTINNCIIRGNVAPLAPGFPWSFAQDGGGIYCSESSPIIKSCHFLWNTATGSGGAIYSYDSSALVLNCVISGNRAGISGGGIGLYKDNMSIRNCEITGNRVAYVSYGGGGIYCSRSTPTIINCTISGNLADGRGGGIYLLGTYATLSNSILWNDAATEGPEIGLRYGGFLPPSLTISYSDVQGGAVGVYMDPGSTLNWEVGNIEADPFFVEPGYWDPNGTPYDANDDFWINGDYHLLAVSPCIDAGDPNYIAEPNETDLDDKPRIIYGRIDMGAYEFQNAPPVANAGPDQIVECACNTEEGTKVILDGTSSYDADGDPLTYTWTGPFVESPVHGATPTVTLDGGCPGDYVITLVVNDSIEESEPNDVVITVVDTTPPAFEFSVAPAMLWPPDHKMVLITPSWTVSDECDATPDVSLVSIVANEGDDTIGDGHTSNDIQIGEDGSIYLRSERSGTSDERIYTITYQAVDDCGNAAIRSATVSIPHDFKVLARIAARWLWAGPGRIPEDLNGDGVVNLKDFAKFAENWIR